MNKKIAGLAFVLFIAITGVCAYASSDIWKEPEVYVAQGIRGEPITYIPKPEVIEEVVKDEWICPLDEEDICLIAVLTMAEAEGETEQGKRLVIDTILNRVDSGHFPNTVHDVIYQKKHFSSVWNGRIDKCYVMTDIYDLVLEELKERTNNEVIFFNAGHYSKYGVPMFQEDHHYFSKYE